MEEKDQKEVGFDEFYAAYPRHKSPNDARKAWRQTCGVRPPLEKMLAAVESAKAEWSRRPMDKIPYPATWLRAHGWEDEDDPQPVNAAWDAYTWANRVRTPAEDAADREAVERMLKEGVHRNDGRG